MRTARIDGVELEYEIDGRGEPVLLIDTGPIADSFRPFVTEPAIADRYRLIRYRQRQPTASADGVAPVSFARHAADAAALLAHLGERRAHVAGHSTGAAVALQLAVDHPAVVHTLALLEPPLLVAPAAARFLARAEPAVAAHAAGDREGAMAAFLTVVTGLGWETCRALLERRIPGSAARAVAQADAFFGSYLPALAAWRFGPAEAAAVTQPALSVVGTETEPLFAESHELLRAWIPQLEDCVIPGVAHLLHLQWPEPVARGVSAFLARHPMSGAGASSTARSAARQRGAVGGAAR